jgi:LEM-3-like GIY-YIG domain/NUMOD3 motif
LVVSPVVRYTLRAENDSASNAAALLTKRPCSEDPMADPRFYIYVLFRETGVPFYVGKGQRDRWLNHEKQAKDHYNPHMRAIIRNMHAAGLDIPKIKLHEHLTEDVALAYEKALILAIGRRDKKTGPLVNLTDGGDGVSGKIFTQEERARMSANRLGKKLRRTPEWRANITAAARNRSPEWRVKLSIIRKGKKNSPESYARGAAKRRGLKRSAETKAKMSVSNTRPWTPKRRAEFSATQKDRVVSAETRAKMSASGKVKVFTAEARANMRAARLAYNKTPEGQAALAKMKARTVSAETRAKLSEANKQKWTPELRAKQSAALRGLKRTPETRAKIAAAKLGKKRSPETLAKLRGRKFTAEHRANIGAAKRGKQINRASKGHGQLELFPS